MKKIFFYITFSIIIFLVCVLMLEVGMRLTRGETYALRTSTQQLKGALFRPNRVEECPSSVKGEFFHTTRYNNFGYRGNDFQKEKTPGKLRVFVVGDSFTYGVGVDDDQTIPAVLEKLLHQDGYDVEVINAGVGSTSPLYHLVNLKNIHLQYKPDLVLLLLDLTDVMDDRHGEVQAIKNARGEIEGFDPVYRYGKRDWWITLAMNSKLCEWIHNKVVRMIEKLQLLGFKEYALLKKDGQRAKAVIINDTQGKFSDDVILEFDSLLMMRGKAREELIKREWKRTANYLTQIHNLLAKHNIPMVLGMYPHGIYVGGDEWAQGRLTWGFEEGVVSKDYTPFFLGQQWAQEQGVPFVNVLDAFLREKKNNPEQKFFWDWDGHMTPIGYHLVAEDIASDPVFINKIEQTINTVVAK